MRLRFDVLTKTKELELHRYWTSRDRAANVRLFRLVSEVLGAIAGGPNGIRTRVSALRGPCPGPLDDGAGQSEKWLGEEGSNPHYRGQNPASYH